VAPNQGIVCFGANHFPKGVENTEERWQRPLKYQLVAHAETNAIFAAARKGIPTKGLIMVSDATLLILTSARNVNVKVFFRDLFPINLTGLEFDAAVTDLDPIIGTATFKFCYIDVEVIGQDQLDLELSAFCPTAIPPP
jgi:hypothetical protein